jgi:hypothetical protein
MLSEVTKETKKATRKGRLETRLVANYSFRHFLIPLGHSRLARQPDASLLVYPEAFDPNLVPTFTISSVCFTLKLASSLMWTRPSFQA